MRQFKHINQALGVERLELVNGTASLHINQIESKTATIQNKTAGNVKGD